MHYDEAFAVDQRKSMRRITVSVADDMHRALRLLSILEGKSFCAVVLEALDFYLKHHNAYDLAVAKKPQGDDSSAL
ncbi:MAG: hypothetical protein FJ077_04645 [Cyanobacteria bacterium K_DeepCast_35m_m2_023]|nr:hypothetical protein [Cyanobacteria bacterium K_DeepCast_35m_m2_023]